MTDPSATDRQPEHPEHSDRQAEPSDSPAGRTEIHPERSESQAAADGMREQAAACRRLAAAARTRAGNSSMTALADHFDAQALGLDPESEKL